MRRFSLRWQLLIYDAIILAIVDFIVLGVYRESGGIQIQIFKILWQSLFTFACVFVARIIGKVYQQVWRHGGIQCYLRLIAVDAIAFLFAVLVLLIFQIDNVSIARLLAALCLNLLLTLTIRMLYRYAYKCAGSNTLFSRFLGRMLHIFAGINIEKERQRANQKIRVAIVGVGRVGVDLSEELKNNPLSAYVPGCFVDREKTNKDRIIRGIPVVLEGVEFLKELDIQEVVFADPDMESDEKMRLYDYYSKAGYKVKVFDFPVMHTEGGKRQLREVDIEELLFRKPIIIHDERAVACYQDKVILITGGGGSIGSELCRQIVKMKPKQVVLLDIYENGVYDVQQELKIRYGSSLDLRIEIASITNRGAMERVFNEYRPNIVINASAHKHVPLMEHNCVEAVENNIFGTKILVELCEKFSVDSFIMLSTDKAVNPTNVMGATKRVCEMIVQSASIDGKTKYSATRFGNVLGSAGSVVPLFKKQIANGGPITITDKRIIRYFMTIPEASQLVLESGAMAKSGELFVLDMGNPVKIVDLAENMIRLSNAQDIDIVEIGLRPGEKLYEELLVKTDELEKTENNLIFIEKESPLSKAEIDEKLALLRDACRTGDNDAVRAALKTVVPTFKDKDEVNAKATAL